MPQPYESAVRLEMADALLPQTAYLDDAALVTALRAQGIRHLAITEPAASYTVLDIKTLICRLADHPEPRLRAALIPLFLRHPDAAGCVPELIQLLAPAAADTLRHFYTAAVYLQRLWLSTLHMYLGSFALLPDHFGQSHYHLSPPDDKFGEAGLRSLARLYGSQTGLDWLSVYDTTMNLFLQQLRLDQVRNG